MTKNSNKKHEELDEETMAVINWCIEVEGHLVKGGATQAQAQEFIEAEIEFLTDQFYDGLSPEEAAKVALSDE
jgi:hypothetical protein